VSSLFKKDKTIPQPTMRDTLFGDESLEKVATYSKKPDDTSCWSHFAIAQQKVKESNVSEAIHELNKVLDIAGLESRVYLQAWHCLRVLGQRPPAETASQIKGVVVEVALDKGLDLVSAYSDHSARYYNFGGAGVVWDASDPNIEKIIDELLAAGQVIINNIGLWEKPRPPAPPKGSVRINLLTYGGLYFGQGEFEALAKDKLGGTTLKLATSLMQALIAKTTA